MLPIGVTRKVRIKKMSSSVQISDSKVPTVIIVQNKKQLALNIVIGIIGLIIIATGFVLWLIGMRDRMLLSQTGRCSSCVSGLVQHNQMENKNE